LAISNFIMFPYKSAYKSDHIILDRKTYENDLKDFSFTFLELPKFKKDINDLETIVEKWMYFFNHAEETSEKDLEKIIGPDEIMERAYDELNRFSWNEAELLTYDQADKYESSYNASMAQKYDEGLEKGEQIGLEKGKIEMALNMLKAGLDKEIVSKIIGLSFTDISQIL